jgi:hypothetical protein
MKSSLRYKVKYEFNPLLNNSTILINKDEKLLKYDNDNSIAHQIELPVQDIIDRYVKFIGEKLSLTAKAIAVLKYIILEKDKSTDKVKVNMEKLKSITGYNSLGPIYAGFNQLVEQDIIARTTYNDQYFINPNFIKPNMIEVGIFTVLKNDKYNEEKVTEHISEVLEDNNELPAGFEQEDMNDF